MATDTRLEPRPAAVEAREQLRGAAEPKSIRDLWALVRELSVILGVEGE